MKVRLDYGKSGLEAELPDANLVAVLGLTSPSPLEDPQSAVRDALRDPIDCAPLRVLAAGKRDACIVVCDITRPVPNRNLLPPILDELQAAGIPPAQVTILIATGTHRPNEGEELTILLGRAVVDSCRIVNHVCTDRDSHRWLGTTENAVPVWIDKTYLEAEVRLTVGLIEPHFMAGYSGGRKLVMPGIMSLETVQAWHSPRFLEHPNAASGIVQGNPVHEEALRIAKMASPDMIVDVTLDEKNRMTGIFAGDLEAAWLRGVAFAEQAVRASVPEPVDIVVTTCAGAPLDATFYQAVKGMVGALPIVKPGGSIIIAAECAEGVGGPDFTRTLLETKCLKQFIEDIQQPEWEFVPDQWEVEELARAAIDREVYCVCRGIPRETLGQLFVTPAESVEAGVEMALQKHGPEATIAAIPKGPYVIPFVASV